MRKIAFLTTGVCLLLASQSAFAVDGSQLYPFSPTAPQAAAPADAMLDAQVRNFGFEPNSEAGKLAKNWLVQIMTDLDWRRVIAPPSGQPGKDTSADSPVNRVGATLTAHERETLFRLFLGIVSDMHPQQCMQILGKAGPPAGVNVLSAKKLNELMNLLNTAVKRSARGDTPMESYSIAQALDAGSKVEMRTEAALRKNKEISASEMEDMPAIFAGKHACIAASATLRSLLEAPEPTRTVASWDMLSSPWHGTASQHVLQKAEQYAMSEFGLDSLPAQLVSRLPVSGSKPLGFRSAVVEGDWDNRLHPEFNKPYRKTYWNLGDTGAVATFLSRADTDKELVWGNFATEFGFAGLRDQEVGTGIRILPPAVFPPSDFAEVSDGNLVPQPNSSFRLPVTQPSTEHVRNAQCETYGKYPASMVAPNLTGDAVDVSCQAISNTGAIKYQVREAYLYDYSISVRLFEIDNDGLTVSRIRSVTMTR